MSTVLKLSGTNHIIDLANGQFAKTSPDDLGPLYKNIKESATGKNLVVLFHGGLVGRKSAPNGAKTLYPVFKTQGRTASRISFFT